MRKLGIEGDHTGPTYRIVKFYFDEKKATEEIDSGLTLEEAKAYCSSDESKHVGCPIEESWFCGFYPENEEDY